MKFCLLHMAQNNAIHSLHNYHSHDYHCLACANVHGRIEGGSSPQKSSTFFKLFFLTFLMVTMYVLVYRLMT